VAAIRQIN